ncbi:MAG: hypothetical protein KC445_18040 [Anaerolineales bacterium]|nr:hypothetical protein [Anaerolineales bacterium]
MSDDSIQQSYDNNAAIRTAVNRLTELLEWLHPDPSPDVFTVRDYRNRYPFTRLGALATEDIDRYQRINRAVGNHVQIGLCEFHIGLIYLHEAAFHGAVQQFELARQQWSFVSQPAAVSLTHLARAVALQMADHYEAALVSVGRVETWLDRSKFAKPVPQNERFHSSVLAYVAELRTALRKQMDERPKTAVATPDDPEQEDDDAPQPPIVNVGRSNLPVPDHRLLGERYDWYLVEARPIPGLLPEINAGDWLLVDVKPDLSKNVQDTEQPILIVMDKKIEGTIRVRPLQPNEKFQRIYLVTLADSPTGKFWRDEETGTVTFAPEMAKIDISRHEILGVVVGFWRPMIQHPSS